MKPISLDFYSKTIQCIRYIVHKTYLRYFDSNEKLIFYYNSQKRVSGNFWKRLFDFVVCLRIKYKTIDYCSTCLQLFTV